MSNDEILLKITNDKIWFNDTGFIDVKQTNIPVEHLRFNTHREIFWKIKMTNFDRSLGKLSVEVIHYDYNHLSAFLHQRPKREIRCLEFGKFEWEQLEKNLSSYTQNKFKDQLINVNERNYDHQSRSIQPNAPKKLDMDLWRSSNINAKYSEVKITPTITELDYEISIDFNDCIFMLGSVEFSKHIALLDQTLNFKVDNENILAEFDNIKYWFSKKLRIKEFKVKIIFTFTDSDLTRFSATSEDIDRIDQSLIQGIKVERTLAIAKSERPLGNDRALFSSENLYSLDNKSELESNVFRQTEKEILDTLISHCNIRNQKELKYLSYSIQSLNYKIRFTKHPYFGFIFFAEGELKNHFIWELLNSHATYIWTIEKGKNEIEHQYERIEIVINAILNCGREKYKRDYRTSTQDDDLVFNIIHHNGKGLQIIDQFPKWKDMINELME